MNLSGLLGLKSSKSCEERWLTLTDSNGNLVRGNDVTGGGTTLGTDNIKNRPAPLEPASSAVEPEPSSIVSVAAASASLATP